MGIRQILSKLFPNLFAKRHQQLPDKTRPNVPDTNWPKTIGPCTINRIPSADGFIYQIDYHHPEDSFVKNSLNPFNVTRLLLYPKFQAAVREIVYPCKISWYDKNASKKPLSNQTTWDWPLQNTTEKFATIDPELLLNNEAYREYVMQHFFSSERVSTYTTRALQENPDRPCGHYMGGVELVNEVPKKFFSPQVGEHFHNLKDMVDRRNELMVRREPTNQRAAQEPSSQSEIADDSTDPQK